ncbi:Imm6 family immunity protein [Clostridium sp.]|uniref:Imm6 family immunity protein n=1 Tax=Clostridium sp. TaxID=1506 RepID=UPI00261849A0|nr:Imm6 family immunity protein [Clostridium sp.]
MNIDFEKLIDDCKVTFFLGLSQKVVLLFSREEDKVAAQNAVDFCWKWLQSKECDGEYLYNLLDDEEYGITLIQEMSENEKEKDAWNCIIDAVAFTSRKAYETEGARYFPEPIELVDDTLVEHFINCFNNCVSNSDDYIQKVYSFLSKYNSDNNSNLKNEILNLI